MKKMRFNSVTLRTIMTILIISISIGTIILFYFVQQSFEKTISQYQSSSTNAMNDQQIQSIRIAITKLKPTANKAATVAISIQDYQNQAIKDLNKYALLSGVVIEGGFSFDRPIVADTSSQFIVGNLLSKPVVITLANPVNLSSFIYFLKLIENNIPLMQVTGINISRAFGSTTDIITDPLTIEVLTR